MIDKKELTWLNDFAENWQNRIRQQRIPHAVLLAGPVGVGKRAAAAWMAAQHLGLPAGELPQYAIPDLEHADLHWLRPPPDKHSIGIEQIRTLVGELGMTSYAGAGKVAVIEPADAMTISAANSLLKTLEEPSGNALLILVTDRRGRLPATIFSRCQRLDIAAPNESEALRWLDQAQPGNQWHEALQIAGNAPLAALASKDQLDMHTAMQRDFAAVASGRASAITVAGQWQSLDTGFVLDWLAKAVQGTILRTSRGGPRNVFVEIDDSVLKRMDRRNLFCYLDIINRLRGQAAGSFNVQLTLEALLIDWANGLRDCGRRMPGELSPALMLQR